MATIRASSLGDLLDCAHRWEAKHVLGMSGYTSGAAWLGTAIHRATAFYDTHRNEVTVGEAVSEVRRLIQTPETDGEPIDVAWTDVSPSDATYAAAQLVGTYARHWSPRYEFLAIEQTLAPLDLTVETPAGPAYITFTGSMDRARTVRHATGAGIVDIKTGKRAVAEGRAVTKGHAAQVAIYQMLANNDPDMPVPVNRAPSILGMSTSTREIATAEIPTATEQLIGPPGGTGLIEYAALYLKTGMFPPNPKSQLCSPKFCPRWDSCRFKE